MRRLIVPLLLAIIALGLVLPRSSVKADGPFTYEFDFTVAQYDGSIGASGGVCTDCGTWVEGTGFLGGTGDDSYTRLYWDWTPDEPYEDVTHVEIQFSGGLSTVNYYFNNPTPLTSENFGGLPARLNPGGVAGDVAYWDFYESDHLDINHLEFFGFINGHFPVSLVRLSITTATEHGDGGGSEGDLPMPLKAADLHPTWGMYDPAYVNSLDSEWDDDEGREPVYAYSDQLGVSVHNIVAGTVTAVDMDITSQCETLDATGTPFAPHACYVVLPMVISGKSIHQVFTIQMTNTALVLVKSDDDPTVIFTYFVTNPHVGVGDHLEPGCIVGETMPLANAPIHVNDLSLGGIVGNSGASGSVSVGGIGLNNMIQTGESVTVVRRDDLAPDITRLYPMLTAEPDESACAGNFSGCLNGASSSLLSFTDWITSDGVTLLSGGGASLPGGSQIYQTNSMTLDDSTDYVMTVQARSTTTGDGFTVVNRIKLFLGETVEQFPITTQWETFSVDFIGEDMFSGDAYGVVNQNAADVGIEVRYVCISGEDTTQAPNACYFKNHHFDDGPTEWTYDGGVTFQSGQAFTYNDSVLEQSARLAPLTGGDATYNLTVAGRLIATSAYTGQSGKYIDISYRFPMSGDYTLIDEIDSVMVEAEGKNVYSGALDIEHTYVLTIPIIISELTTGLFSIKTTVTDSDNYLKGFRIDYACLQSTTDDGSFPGQGGAGFDPPFYENCEVVSIPQDNNVSSWTYYHWSNLKRFFDCTLMVKLNQMFSLMNDAWKTTRLFFRWIVATIQFGGRWISTQFFPWLGGHFRNIAFGQVTTVYQAGGGGGCSDFFCVLDGLINGLLTPINNIVNTLLSLLTVGVNLLLTVITGIIGLALAFLTRLLGLFNQATGLLTGLLNAYNTATPTAIDGLPMCNVDPTSSLFCRGTWLLDNTILSGRWGILLTLIIGVAGIHLILWVIGEFKSAIVTTGSGS